MSSGLLPGPIRQNEFYQGNLQQTSVHPCIHCQTPRAKTTFAKDTYRLVMALCLRLFSWDSGFFQPIALFQTCWGMGLLVVLTKYDSAESYSVCSRLGGRCPSSLATWHTFSRLSRWKPFDNDVCVFPKAGLDMEMERCPQCMKTLSGFP